MKIDAFVRSVAPSPTAPPAVTIRFADLIAAPIHEAAPPEAFARTFSARGMFGRYGAVEAPSIHAPYPVGSALPAPAEPGLTAPSEAPSLAPVPAGVPVLSSEPFAGHVPARPTGTPSPARAPAATASDLPTAGPDAPPSLDAPAPPGPEAEGADMRPSETVIRSREPLRAQPPSTATLLLGPIDATGSANLAIRAVGMDPNEAARFRSRAQALLREHGITLDKVRLNGEGYFAPCALGRGTQSWR